MDRRHLITITLMCCLVAVTGCEPSSNASRDSGPDGQVVAADEPVAVHGANAARPLCVIVRQPGTSAEEIESAVTVPIERAVQHVPGVAGVRSSSVEGASRVVVNVPAERDFDQIKQAMATAMAGVADQLPADAEPPLLTTLEPGVLPGLWVILASDQFSPSELGAMARNIRNRLTRLPGVLAVEVWGEAREELQVTLDPGKLAAFGMSVNECLETIERAAANGPASARELSELVLSSKGGKAVRLLDIANVQRGTAPEERQAWWKGDSAAVLGVFVGDDPAGDETAKAWREEVQKISAELPQGITVEVLGGLPLDQERGVIAQLLGPAGVQPDQLRRLAEHVERAMASLVTDGVLSLWRRDDAFSLQLVVRPKVNESELLETLRRVSLPGALLRMARWKAGKGAARQTFDVELLLTGPRRETLAEWAAAVASRLRDAGYLDVFPEIAVSKPDLQIKLDRERLQALGVEPKTVLQTIEAGRVGVHIVPKQRDATPIRVRAGETVADIGKLLLTAGENSVPLMTVASVELSARPQRLDRYNGRPVVRITACSPASGSEPRLTKQVLALADEARKKLELPAEFRAELP